MFNMSVNSIYKRVKSMVDLGVSKSFESVKVTVLLEGKNFLSWVDKYSED